MAGTLTSATPLAKEYIGQRVELVLLLSLTLVTRVMCLVWHPYSPLSTTTIGFLLTTSCNRQGWLPAIVMGHGHVDERLLEYKVGNSDHEERAVWSWKAPLGEVQRMGSTLDHADHSLWNKWSTLRKDPSCIGSWCERRSKWDISLNRGSLGWSLGELLTAPPFIFLSLKSDHLDGLHFWTHHNPFQPISIITLTYALCEKWIVRSP
jgi:hypothetical protein